MSIATPKSGKLLSIYPMLYIILSFYQLMYTFFHNTLHRMLKWLYFIMQFLLVDLRCHGDSSLIKKRVPHTVASAALDVLKLVGNS